MTTQLTDARVAPRHRGECVSPPAAMATAILTAFAAGDVSARALAARYGISEGTVRRILRGETCRDAPEPRLSAERIAELSERHRAEAQRAAGCRTNKLVCSGCGKPGHAITKCEDPRG